MLYCVHFVQLKIHPVIYTLCLPFGTRQNQKVRKSSHDGLQNFITPTFLNIGPMISKSEDRVVGISSFPH